MTNPKLLLLGTSVLALSVSSVSSDPLTDGKNFALDQNATRVVPLAETPDVSGVPNYSGANVPEQHYYGLGLGIEDEARAAAGTNPGAQFIYGSRASRPDINLDRHNDPLFQRYNEVRDLSSSLTDTYSECVDLPTGDPSQNATDLRTCDVTRAYRTERTECHTTYRAQCSNDEVYEQPVAQEVTIIAAVESTDDYGAIISVDLSTNQWTVQSDSGERGTSDQFVQLSPLTVENPCGDYATRFEFVDQIYWTEAGNALGAEQINAGGIQPQGEAASNLWSASISVVEHPSCSNGLRGLYSVSIDSSFSFPQGPHAAGGVFQYQVIHEETCPYELVEERECPLPASGSDPVLVSSTCVESGFREVQGQPVYMECWDTQEFWDVTLLGTEDSSQCDALSSEGCGYRGRECLVEADNGTCLEERHTYACDMPTGERTVSLCGNQLICPDGQCTDDVGQDYESAEDDFAEAAAGMTAAGETSEEFDPELNAFFNGDPKRCVKKDFDIADCCSGDGWGLDLGLDMCDAEEIELGYARQADRAIYVGRYTSGGLLDRRRNYVYCTYPSEMSRSLVQQGKAQLGLGFGSARNPDCAGLSPEELSQLDMNSMDFSSMFPDLMSQAGAGVPTGENLQQIIIEKLEQMFPDD